MKKLKILYIIKDFLEIEDTFKWLVCLKKLYCQLIHTIIGLK